MSGYVPKVGDKVLSLQSEGVYEVLAICGPYLWITPIGSDSPFTSDAVFWEPYVEPVVYPERWSNVYRTWMSGSYPTRLLADRGAMQTEPRLGVLHLRPDGTTEMEAP